MRDVAERNADSIEELQAAADKAADEARQAFAEATALEKSEGLSWQAREAYVNAAGLNRKATAAMRRLLAALPD